MKRKSIELLFSLLKSAILGEKLSDTVKSSFTPNALNEMKAISAKHDMQHLLAWALDMNGLLSMHNEELELSIVNAVFRYENSNYDYENICKLFESNGISFIPLKGLILRRYYPEGWMRTSCDIDILVHKEDLDKAAFVLQESLKFVYYSKSSHDVSFISPNKTHVELHYDLIEDDRIKKSADVMSGVWETSLARAGYKYYREMSDEMFYFYHIAHMAKHFENGGCGIRSFVDLWILNRVNNADFSKREKLLKQGELYPFYNAVTKLCKIWFDGDKMDYASQCMETFIVCGGTYGSSANSAMVKSAMGEGKARYFLKIMFLPKESLAEQYPNLKKYPILFPFYQIKRWFGVFDREKREKVRRLTRIKNGVTKEDVNSTVELLEFLGLTEK